ncbi:MAG: DNA alkylation repair protein [Bacteroidales bacterium]|jgi:3-methyladenine DNA glycosylase AlkD|nr:DNA alkylation repair protein [Bacteroidales bacterium]
MTAKEITSKLKSIGEENGPAQLKVLQSFFKTGKGQYGEGDIFYGVKVPQTRELLKQCGDVPKKEIVSLLESPIHECRLFALLYLSKEMQDGMDADADTDTDVDTGANADEIFSTRTKLMRSAKLHADEIFSIYTSHFNNINNWDLVDLSAPNITGAYIFHHFVKKSLLKKWALSNHLWTQRIAILSTFYFIKNGSTIETFEISKILLNHPHDLIQKAVGWMLREVGKRVSHEKEIEFLLDNNRYKTMPRTMLRYAIERFPEAQKQAFLRGTI